VHSLLKPAVMGGEAYSGSWSSPSQIRTLANLLGTATLLAAATTQGLRMTRKDLVAVYGQVGLTIAALALVAGIIAAPILPKFGSPAVAVAKTQDEPTFRSLVTPASFKTN
jgi:hypothetical protein